MQRRRSWRRREILVAPVADPAWICPKPFRQAQGKLHDETRRPGCTNLGSRLRRVDDGFWQWWTGCGGASLRLRSSKQTRWVRAVLGFRVREQARHLTSRSHGLGATASSSGRRGRRPPAMRGIQLRKKLTTPAHRPVGKKTERRNDDWVAEGGWQKGPARQCIPLSGTARARLIRRAHALVSERGSGLSAWRGGTRCARMQPASPLTIFPFFLFLLFFSFSFL
jgi:hypothetical protein